MSFIKYDSLSRPIEGGVASLSSNFTNFAYINNVPLNMSTIWDRFVQIYDTASAGSPIPTGHFRGRVTTHKVWQKWTGTEEPDYIVYYDYDLMGRVKREIHQIPMLKRFKHDKFEMSYLYDAVSGKVKEMVYNKGKKDAFRHRFAYDAMGNLKYVWTSRDGKHWTLESALKYYPDGKLMRREIRPKDLMLQGLDYAYTLDGWLKAINSEVLENDPSKDGISGKYKYFARDVFSLLLRYYPNDYKPIKLTATPLEAGIVSGNSHLYKPYYTGWISSWSLNLDTLHTAYSFRYDRLGRLTKATTLTGFDGTEWSASLIKNYSTKYSYDLVGNILNLTRYDGTGRLIDELEYKYYNLASNNRLEYIADKEGQIIGIDLDNQSPRNYRYDPVGNMIFDKSRNLKVSYTYSNKPRRINFGGQTIRMLYNPSGYRFFKGKGPNKGQIFVYNSQGQLMAKYMIDGRKLKLDFMPIYEGTRRLGILEPSEVLWIDCPPPRLCFEEDSLGFVQLLIPSGGGSGGVLKAERKYELVDHLGNVRVVIRDQRVPISQDGSTVAYYKPFVESIHDYYPFGWEKQLTTVNPYPFNYQGQLFDADLGWQYYRYRNYDPLIARFHQVEPLIDSFPWLGGYVFTQNYVIYAVELEGLEAYFVHGTWSDPSTWDPTTMEAVAGVTGNKTIVNFEWSGDNMHQARIAAAQELVNKVLATMKEDEPLVLVAHSHGGNVAILAANMLYLQYGIKVDYLITIATPVRDDYQLIPGAVRKHINIYNKNDMVQSSGGDDVIVPLVLPVKGKKGTSEIFKTAGYEVPWKVTVLSIELFGIDLTGKVVGSGEVGKAGRQFKGAINIGVDIPARKHLGGHSFHNEIDLWLEKLKNAIGNTNQGNQDQKNQNNQQ